MIKKRDEFAGPDFDIDILDESALSGRSLDEIAGDAGSAEWESNSKDCAAQRRGVAAGRSRAARESPGAEGCCQSQENGGTQS